MIAISPGVSPIITGAPEQTQQPTRFDPKAKYVKELKFRWHDLMSREHQLTYTQYRLATVLWNYADTEGGNIFPSRERLAEEVGVSKKTIDRNLARLEALCWIACEAKGNRRGRQGLNSIYSLRIPPRFLLPASVAKH